MISQILIFFARNARLLLIAGLVAGIALPDLAAAMSPWLAPLIGVLLIVTAFRIGHREAFGAVADLRWSLGAVFILQLFIPLAVFAGAWVSGVADTPLALALVLAVSAPTISGGASLAIILRQDPARMMQILILGTALFPLTVLPTLSLFPHLGGAGEITVAALRALVVILGAASVGFVLRHRMLPNPDARQLQAMDGANVFFFALIVVGLMAALGPMIRTDPMQAALWTLSAFALSFGLQALTLLVLRQGPLRRVAGPLALAAGNRNVALFLIALSPEVMAPVMIFVACWQLPMYLTPLLLPRLYRLVPPHE